MTAPNLKVPSPLAAKILRLAGLVLVLSFGLDLLILLTVAPQFGNPQWQLGLVEQAVDRGVVPLIGFALLYAGAWIDTTMTGQVATNKSPWQDWRFWAFVFASLLGLLFLVGIPLHLGASEDVVQQAIKQTNQETAQDELRIQRDQQQLQAVLNSGQLPDILKSNQVPEEQKAILRQAQQDPQGVAKRFEQLREQVRERQNQKLDQTRSVVLLNRIRVGSRALLLTAAFALIGWNGLRDSR